MNTSTSMRTTAKAKFTQGGKMALADVRAQGIHFHGDLVAKGCTVVWRHVGRSRNGNPLVTILCDTERCIRVTRAEGE